MENNLEIEEVMFLPECKFCHSTQIPLGKYESQEQANEAATMRCGCYRARSYQEEAERLRQKENNFIKITQAIDEFAQFCEKRDVEITRELVEVLAGCGKMILDDEADTFVCTINRCKFSIKKGAKGKVAVAFSCADSAKIEV